VTTDTGPAPALPAFGASEEEHAPRERRGFIGGRLASIGFVEDGAIGPVALGSQDAVLRIAASGRVGSIRQTATGLERLLRSGGATLHERVFVPLDAPFVLLEWRARRGDASVALEQVQPGCVLHAWPGSALAGAAPGGSVRIPADGTVVVAVASPGLDRGEIARRAPALVRARSAAAGRAAAACLALEAGGTSLAAAWRRAREALLAGSDPPTPDVHRARLVLGLRDGAPLRGDARAGTAAAVEMAAATLAWTGDAGAIHDVWRHIRPVLTDPAGPPGHDGLVALAEAMGDAAAVAALRSRRPARLVRSGPAAGAARPERPDRDFDTLPADLPFASPAAAAAFVLEIADRLLGLAPDASRNRLVMAPRIPASWPGLSALRLRMGDSTVSLRHARGDGGHHFAIEQEAGPVPVLLVLQPTVPSGSWRFEVDGVAADLDARHVDGGLGFAVQLVLDSPRAVAALPAG
jgi:hypothetical protein